jgi:hypothetical protein
MSTTGRVTEDLSKETAEVVRKYWTDEKGELNRKFVLSK